MLPLSDGLSPRRFPFVNVAIIVANFAVWLVYEVPHLDASIAHASFYPCTVDGSCHGPEPWGISWFTAMFMHGSWGHILGNMLFLASSGRTSRTPSATSGTSPSTSSAGSSQPRADGDDAGRTTADSLVRTSARAARSRPSSARTSSSS
jgi:hypothetical protein